MRFKTLAARCSLVALACCTAVQAQAYPLNANWFFLEDLGGEFIVTIGLAEASSGSAGKGASAVLSYFCSSKNELLLHVTPSSFTLPASAELDIAYTFDEANREEAQWLSTGDTFAPYRGDVRSLTTRMLEAETFSISLLDASDTDRSLNFDVAGVAEGLNTLPCYRA